VKQPSEIYIDVRGGLHEGKSICLTLPWDANLEDWKEAFVTILTHQTYSPDTINELFYDESAEADKEYLCQLDFDPISSKPNLSSLFERKFDDSSTFDKQESNMANAY
jgi:hypothetical protein